MGDGSDSSWDPGNYSKYGGPYRYGRHSSYEALLERSKSREYDVFINHQGLGTKTFVARLYADLKIHGFQPCLEMKDNSRAFPVFKEINKALVKGACVHVAIFSKRYAESEYCLDELCEMLKSVQRIIPVFYDIKTNDLRKIEDGPYKEAFIKHQKRERIERILIWKEALRKVADYKGFGMDEVNG